jgi:hypothetical protein
MKWNVSPSFEKRSDEEIQSRNVTLYCFASLAMTIVGTRAPSAVILRSACGEDG